MEASARPHRWFDPAPAWLVYAAATAVGVLYASERWRWFFFNEHKGFTVLIAVAVVGVVFLLLAAWTLLALVFRRRMQFGLRSLIVFVTICALVCSWTAVRVKRARRQATAVKRIEALEGTVHYITHSEQDASSIYYQPPPAPTWPLTCLGYDFFEEVGDAFLERHLDDESQIPSPPEPKITDSDLECLKDLPRLRWLALSNTQITDKGISCLGGLQELEMLDLDDTGVGDDGLARLRGLARLKELHLDGTKITDAGLQYVSSLPGLRLLIVSRTEVTDAGLRHLATLHLSGLWLLESKVTDAGVKDLRRALPNCEVYH